MQTENTKENAVLSNDESDAAFEAAFNARLAEVTSGVEIPEPEKQEEVPAEEVAEVVVEAAKPEEQETPAPTPAPAQKEDNSVLADLKAEVEALRKEREETARKVAAAQEKAEELAKEDEEDLTPEEKEFLEEWPGIAKSVTTMLARQQAKFDKQQKALESKLSSYDTNLQPVTELYAQAAQERFNLSIERAHPKFQEFLPKLGEWVQAQPAALRDAYLNIIQTGTAEDAVSLISTAKAALGYKEQAAPAAQAAAPDPKRAEKLAKMAGLKTERTGVADAVDPNDFEGAFERRMRQLNQQK